MISDEPPPPTWTPAEQEVLDAMARRRGPGVVDKHAQLITRSDKTGRDDMNNVFFRVAVLLLLTLVCLSQLVQGYESLDRLVTRSRIRARLPELESLAKKAIFEDPNVKGIWHQLFLQEQINSEYLKVIAQK
jgi:hypothetical protein